jgi:hypothetical protein
MAGKQRVPIPEDISAEVLHAADKTCSVCRDPSRSPQIHHIDENPSNNEVSNLAVLCLECHRETQIRGGFTKTLSAELVRRYRDEWLAIVQERRSRLVSLLPPISPTSTQPQMTQAQARLRAKELRLLYQDFGIGLIELESVAEKLRRPFRPDETFDARLQSLQPAIDQAVARITRTWPQILVEPGAEKVYEEFNKFSALYRANMDSVRNAQRMDSRLMRALDVLSNVSIADKLKKALASVQMAVREHIQSVDNLT